jgi:hypothetical protein
MKTRRCPTCKETKPLTEYFKSVTTKTGVQGYCKKCQTVVDRKMRERRKLEGPTIIRQSKVCQICNNTKPVSQFGVRRDAADGLMSYCKPCWTIYVKNAQRKIAKRVL